MPAGYTINTQGDIALSAATAKTILNVINASNSLIRLTEIAVSFDGVSATAEPVTVELCSSTQATAGTSTSETPAQIRGPTRTVQASGARNYTAEPTTLTAVKRWLVHPQTGLVLRHCETKSIHQPTRSGGVCAATCAKAGYHIGILAQSHNSVSILLPGFDPSTKQSGVSWILPASVREKVPGIES